MSASLRWQGSLTRADTTKLDPVFDFDTFGTYANFSDRELSIAASGDFTVTGFTVINEVMVYSDGVAVDVELTKTGPTAFEFSSSGLLVLNNVSLIGLKVTNPSGTTAVSVRLIVAGS